MWLSKNTSAPTPTTPPPDPAAWVQHRLKFHPDPDQRGLLNSTSRRVLLNCTRQWGKSTVAAAKAVYEASHSPGSLILVVSPSMRQSAEFLRKAAHFLKPLERPRRDRDHRVSLALRNRARIIGIAGDPSRLRGFSAPSLLVIENAAYLSDDLYHAMLPMLSAGGALWLLGTPAGKRGFFHEVSTSAAPDWLRVRIPATQCPRIPTAFLDEERRALPDRWFRQEYLCEFAEDKDALFSYDTVKRAFTSDFEPLDLS